MLIQFSFSNYKSFKDKAVLKLTASNYDKDTREGENIMFEKSMALRLLKSTVVFGANASGKSKFSDAFVFFVNFILESSRESTKSDPIRIENFSFNTQSRVAPSEFEIVFIQEGVRYRYGFEATRKEIISEWLYYRPKSKEIELFYRDGQHILPNEKLMPVAKTLHAQGLVRGNALLLSVLGQFNDQIAGKIIDYMRSINCISGLNEMQYKRNAIEKVKEDSEHQAQILKLIQAADLGIEDIRYEDLLPFIKRHEPSFEKFLEFKDMMEELDPHMLSTIRTRHKVYDENNQEVESTELSMQNDESDGTQKYFFLTGLILDSLEKGTLLFVDELDSKLHPNLVCKIVSMFNSKLTNPKGAQLVFNSHDTNLLSSGLFRRDQVWFIEKDRYGASTMFSLADFKTSTVRKKELFEENYVRGKYGAIPFLGEFDRIVEMMFTEDGKAE
ncbi:MAG: AAA family ATPase [Bacteroidia bacterium]